MTGVSLVDDVTIVGAGPAGAVAALCLARRGYRVRVIDRATFPRDKLCGDTLNPGALGSLAPLVDLTPVVALGLSLRGMRISGPGGAVVEARYPAGVTGLAISRRHLDQHLLAAARRAGATIDEGVVVRGVHVIEGRAAGVIVATPQGDRMHPSRIVMAADGRTSLVARSAGLASTPRRPRRWAFGAYADGVTGMAPDAGEMHVRQGRYIGLAPLAGSVTNVCVVVSRDDAARMVASPWPSMLAAVSDDEMLASRLAGARPLTRPVVLGPVAVDVASPAVPGLLLAGDAAGFIDPMTGDGLRLAIDGAVIAADVADDVLAGRVAWTQAPHVLTARRRRAFAAKWRFNRSLRALVDVPDLVQAATWVARAWPGALEAVVRYAGDARQAA
jgi:menaquinone-9 beta-reductase